MINQSIICGASSKPTNQAITTIPLSKMVALQLNTPSQLNTEDVKAIALCPLSTITRRLPADYSLQQYAGFTTGLAELTLIIIGLIRVIRVIAAGGVILMDSRCFRVF